MSQVRDTTAMRIRERRIALGMTQEELAMACGYTGRSSINKIEMDARNVPLEKLVLISQSLRVSPSYLMGWADAPFSEDLDRQEKESEIQQLFDLLTPDRQDIILKLVRDMVRQNTAPQADPE